MYNLWNQAGIQPQFFLKYNSYFHNFRFFQNIHRNGKMQYENLLILKICQQIWKTQQWPQDWKRLVFIPIPNKDNAKECSNYRTIAFISHASKVMHKILQARLQQAGFRKGRRTRDQIANVRWIMEKQESSKKTSISAFLTMPKSLCGSQ